MASFQPINARIAFGIALAVLGAAGILLARDRARMEQIARQVGQSRDVIAGLENIVVAFRDSVSASRGYSPDAAQLHRQAVESIQAALQDVRQGPVACWVREEEHLREMPISITEGLEAHGPAISAVRDGTRFVSNDIASDPRVLPWRNEARARGYVSGAALPIKMEAEVAGALTAFAEGRDFFDEESLRLLDEVNSDISFALHTMEQEEQRRIAESEVRRLDQDLEQRVLERTSQLGDADSRLATQNEELARASRMKSEFLARMSHEFRTPLNSIIGFTDLLAEEGEGPLGEAYSDYVRHVHDGAHHLLTLVSDILDLSRIEAGRIDLRHEEFAAADAIREILSFTGPLAEAKNIQVRSEVSPTLFAHGDRTRFKQILCNLLSNAVKFTPSGGSVQVTAEPDYGEIRCGVSDTGIGIPPEQQGAIFEEFTQVAPATSAVKEGTGLGLAITKRIVELHGGRIWVESTPGEGSRFFSPCRPLVAASMV